jgi:hypothetical protein
MSEPPDWPPRGPVLRPMLRCPDPVFVYNYILKHWTTCIPCGRPAWDHEQADPLADMRNYLAELRGAAPIPPAMLTAAQWAEREARTAR